MVGVRQTLQWRQRQQSLQRLLQKRPLPRRPHRKRLHRRQNRKKHPWHQLTPPLSDFSILNPFSDGELVKSETTGTWQTHNGVDLSCAAGSDVFAIDTGTVSEVCSDALWGYTVTIDHDNGITSRYCGLDGTLEVREGDTVQTGQKLGVTGANPDLESAAEPHLHLEVKKGGAYVDPTAYFG